MKDFHLPLHSRSVISRIGVVPRAPEKGNSQKGSYNGVLGLGRGSVTQTEKAERHPAGEYDPFGVCSD